MNNIGYHIYRIVLIIFVFFAAGAVALAACSYPAYDFGSAETAASLWQFLLPSSLVLPLALAFSNLAAKKLGAVSVVSSFVLSLTVAAAPVIFRSAEGLDGAFFVGGSVMFFGAFSIGSIISDQAGGFFEKHTAASLGLSLAGYLALVITALYLLFFIVKGILPNIALVFALLPLDTGMLLILAAGRTRKIPLAFCCTGVFISSVFAVLYFSSGAYISFGVLAAALIYTAVDKIVNK